MIQFFKQSCDLDQIRPCSAELAALEHLQRSFTYLITIKNNFMTCLLSGERSLPFRLLVAQYLENGWKELTKFCIHIIIDKI